MVQENCFIEDVFEMVWTIWYISWMGSANNTIKYPGDTLWPGIHIGRSVLLLPERLSMTRQTLSWHINPSPVGTSVWWSLISLVPPTSDTPTILPCDVSYQSMFGHLLKIFLCPTFSYLWGWRKDIFQSCFNCDVSFPSYILIWRYHYRVLCCYHHTHTHY